MRTSVVAWFHAVRMADVDAVATAMSATCPSGFAEQFVDSFRAARSAGLQDADVGQVKVLSIVGDRADAQITLDLSGTFGTGASDPGVLVLLREDGHWVVSC